MFKIGDTVCSKTSSLKGVIMHIDVNKEDEALTKYSIKRAVLDNPYQIIFILREYQIKLMTNKKAHEVKLICSGNCK